MKSSRWVFWAFVAVSVLLELVTAIIFNGIDGPDADGYSAAEAAMTALSFIPFIILFGFCCWMSLYLDLYLRVIEPRRDEARHRPLASTGPGMTS